MMKKILVLLLGITLIGVTGCTKQENSESTQKSNKTLIEQGIKVGDYVNYDAASGEGAGQTYTVDTSRSRYTFNDGETFQPSAETKWRVLSVKGEKIELVAEDEVGFLALGEAKGYKNAEAILNEIGAIFGKGNGAESGRSINIDDIEQYSAFDKTTYRNGSRGYGQVRTYTAGTFIMEDGTEKTASDAQPIEMRDTDYSYEIKDYIDDDTIYEMFWKNYKFWIASRSVMCSDEVSFNVRFMSKGNVSSTAFTRSDFDPNQYCYSELSAGVLPVVTLKSGIRGEKRSDGVWNLDL